MKLLDAEQLPFELNLGRLGFLLKAARENLGISLRELASLAHVSPAQMVKIEKGDADFGLATFWRLCGILGVPAPEALDYGFQEKTEFGFQIREPDEAIERAVKTAAELGIGDIEARRNVLSFIHAECRRTAWILMMPEQAFVRVVSEDDLPNPRTALGTARLNLTMSVFHYDNSDRALALTSLVADPLRKLKSLGLLSDEILRIAASTESSPFSPGPKTDTAHTTARTHVVGLIKKQSSVDKQQSSIHPSSNPKKEPVNLDDLIERLRRVLAPRGRRASLAREFGISRQAVDNWLAGKAYPKSEAVFPLLEWVQTEETKQKAQPVLATPTEPKTRTRKNSDEKPRSSPKKE